MMQFLTPVRNLETAKKIDEILSWAVRCQWKPRGFPEIVLFKLTGWIAVPLIPETFNDLSVLNHITEALQAYGYKQLYATQLFTAYYDDSYLVPVTLEGLNEFRREVASLSAALFIGEPEPNWVIISIDADYYFVAGSADFISQILPWSIEEAFSRFQNFVLHEQICIEATQYLQRVHDQLKNNYPKAECGDEFRL